MHYIPSETIQAYIYIYIYIYVYVVIDIFSFSYCHCCMYVGFSFNIGRYFVAALLPE